jgi:DNA processing protein
MLTTAEDLIYMLNWDIEEKKAVQTSLFIELNDEQKKITDKLAELGKCELDNLSLACGIPTFKLASMLLELELSGVVRPLPGKQFELI